MKAILLLVSISMFIVPFNAEANKHKYKKKARHKTYPTENTIIGRDATPKKIDMNTPRNHPYKESNYHNEQDDFRRKDSANYHPSRLGDSSGTHSYYDDREEDQNRYWKNKATANPAVSFGFNAEYCTNNTPPDNTIAVSNDGNIISAVNCGIVFYNSGGGMEANYNYQTFFNNPQAGFSDPRIIYDPYTDRFIFFIQFGSSSATSLLYVAFSKNNHPIQLSDWYAYSYAITSFSILPAFTWFDYPSVAINQNDFCVTGNIFNDNSGTFSTNLVVIIDKQSGYNGASLPTKYWTNVRDQNNSVGFTIAPATAGQAISYSNVFYFVSTPTYNSNNYITKYTLIGTAVGTPTLSAGLNVGTQVYAPSAIATQPGGNSLANNKAGCRVQSAIYLNGNVYFVFSADYQTGGYDYNSIYFNRLNVSTNDITQNLSYLSGSNYNYPSIASFGTSQSDGAIILCFLKSDALTYPEIRFKYFDDAMNQLGSAQAQAGNGSVYYSFAGSQQRWGDYTGIQRRYTASQPEVWLSGSYGNTSALWQTFIAQITGYPGNVSVSQINLNDRMPVVYPNPVTNQLYVKGDLTLIKSFPELYSIDGKHLRTDATRKGNEMFQIDVSQLMPGDYLLRFGEKQVVKFTKN